ncbi:MAG: tetratricopeptide repeat protein, partial [Bacteroidetes bacterium]|nr:tetratricopeptide repeat protein [Bacteroidota bacterium]
MKKIFVLLLFSILLETSLLAEETDQVFRQANEAFQQKEFEKAVKLYDQILEAGYRSPELEYNLGNAWYRLNRPGKAILHYERALLLAPNDPEVLQNLTLVRSKLPDEIEPLPDFFLKKWWGDARMALSAGTMGSMALVLWWLSFACLVFWQTGKTRRQKKRGLLAGVALLLLSLLPFSLALSRTAFEKNTRQAIVLEKTASLRSAPDEAGAEVLLLHEGTKVEQQELLSGWWR